MSLVLVLLLQSFAFLPARTGLENPAIQDPVPRQFQKDYDKTWARFLKAREDGKVVSETNSLLKKKKDLIPALKIQFYVHAYAGRSVEAERKLEEVLVLRPADSLSLNYLADSAYARRDFTRAADLYTRLVAVDGGSRPDLETKRQKALLLAVETLLGAGREALNDNRLADAESHYREALTLAPGEASLHGELAGVLLKSGKWEQAVSEYQRQIDLGGSNGEAFRGIGEALAHLGRGEDPRLAANAATKPNAGQAQEPGFAELEELGRWGTEIERFRAVVAASALSREQFSWLITRYFPQIVEFPHNRQVLTDVHESWAAPEIHNVVGLGLLDPMPNHTFQPARTLNRIEFVRGMSRLTRLLEAIPPDDALKLASGASSGIDLDRDLLLVSVLGLMVPGDLANPDFSARVSGGEAVNAAEKLHQLLRKKGD